MANVSEKKKIAKKNKTAEEMLSPHGQIWTPVVPKDSIAVDIAVEKRFQSPTIVHHQLGIDDLSLFVGKIKTEFHCLITLCLHILLRLFRKPLTRQARISISTTKD